MADFAVAHDALRKTDGLAGRLQHRMRIALEERVPVRQVCRRDRIAVRRIAASPAVEHAENDGPVLPPCVIRAQSKDGSFDQRREAVGIERGAADQTAVDIGALQYAATFAAFMLPP